MNKFTQEIFTLAERWDGISLPTMLELEDLNSYLLKIETSKSWSTIQLDIEYPSTSLISHAMTYPSSITTPGSVSLSSTSVMKTLLKSVIIIITNSELNRYSFSLTRFYSLNYSQSTIATGLGNLSIQGVRFRRSTTNLYVCYNPFSNQCYCTNKSSDARLIELANSSDWDIDIIITADRTDFTDPSPDSVVSNIVIGHNYLSLNLPPYGVTFSMTYSTLGGSSLTRAINGPAITLTLFEDLYVTDNSSFDVTRKSIIINTLDPKLTNFLYPITFKTHSQSESTGVGVPSFVAR